MQTTHQKKLGTRTRMHPTTQQDPLFLGRVVLSKEDAPRLTSGHSMLSDLEDRARTSRPVDTVLAAPPDILEHFGNIFPEIVESNHVGKFQGDDVWKTWTNTNNEIGAVSPRANHRLNYV